MTDDRCCLWGLVRIRQRAMPGPGKSTDMALSIRMGNIRAKTMPCAPKKYPGKVLFFKQFLCILRAVSLCVYTKSAHTQVFSGIFVRIFTRRKCRHFRHRAAASAVGSLCRGLREWEVSVLLHCHLIHFAGTKISMYRIPSKDFGILVIPFFHLVVPFIHAIPSIRLYFSCLRMFFITGFCTALPSPSGTGSPVAAGCPGSGRPRTPPRNTLSC